MSNYWKMPNFTLIQKDKYRLRYRQYQLERRRRGAHSRSNCHYDANDEKALGVYYFFGHEDEDIMAELNEELGNERDTSFPSDQELKQSEENGKEKKGKEEKPIETATLKKKKKRRGYSQLNIDEFIGLLVEGISLKEAASKGVNKRGRKVGTVSELKEQHSHILIDLIDRSSTMMISEMHELLLKQFPEISHSKSALYSW
ncbi:MAG: hypothetical protein EXX96DRAFT_613322 [Benjaminiella poitrasii]|nr:MAG: hypothetical protein EXX96DRAFT_613322 [Benjaminiella poitrasii]